jgi:hypothetical protein
VRLHLALGYDDRRARLVVFGGFGAEARMGDLWEWDGSSWTDRSAPGPEARAEHDGAFVPRRGLVIFGGVVGQGMAVAERKRASDFWAWDGTSWRSLSP